MSRRPVLVGHGSSTLSGLLGKRKVKEAEREEEAEKKRQRAEERAKAKAERDAAFKALYDAYQRCKGGCVCDDLEPGVEACEASQMKLCPFCGALKKKACAKKSCKAARLEAERAEECEEEGGDGGDD